MTPTRGERNCNPGNLEFVSTFRWRGQLPHDPTIEPRFARFESAHYGLRALARNLLTYYRTHRIDTVRGIVSRWAPSGENDTDAYVRHVSRLVGVDPDTPMNVSLPASLHALVRAIVLHENGRCLYSDEDMAAAVAHALDSEDLPAPTTEARAEDHDARRSGAAPPTPEPPPAPPTPEPPPAPPKPAGNWLEQKLTPEEYAAAVRWMRAEAARLAATRLQSAIRGASRSWTVRLNTLAAALALAWPHVAPWVTSYLGADAVALLVALYAACNVALRAKTDKPLADR
jgi:hypothetical protein